MNAQAAQIVYDEIVAHIKQENSGYPKWYAGIASDWRNCLFERHQVPREKYWYIARQCFTEDDARRVEAALLKLGCDGGSGGGDYNTIYVYAYLKGTMTNP